MADIRDRLRHNFHVLGIACILVLSGTGFGMNAFADNHTTTITLQDLGVLQLVAHDLFDVRRGDNMTPESAVDFENGRLDLSTLLVNTTSGNYFDNATIAMGGEVRNRENVVMFTVSSNFGEMYLNFTKMEDSQKVAREKTLLKRSRDIIKCLKRHTIMVSVHVVPRKTRNVIKTHQIRA